MIRVNPLYLNFIISTALPALTALVTHQFASKSYKTTILVVLSVVGGVVNALIQQKGSFSFTQAGIWTIATFIIASVMHSGLLKPLGITGSAGVLQTRFPGGLGKPSLPADSGSGSAPTSMG